VRKMTEGATAAVGTFGGGSLYDILECPFGSPIDKLKAAYRRLARKWHPDVNNSENAAQKYQEITEAWKSLNNVEKKEYYDLNFKLIQENKFVDMQVDLMDINASINLISATTDFFLAGNKTIDTIIDEEIKYGESKTKHLRFGDEDASRDEVHAFYSQWAPYCTSLKFFWLNENVDIGELDNRQDKRAYILHNKKKREAATKARNFAFRELIKVMKENDPRVAKFKEEKQRQLEKQKEERKRKQLQERMDQDAAALKAVQTSQNKEDLAEIDDAIKDMSFQYCDKKSNELFLCEACHKRYKVSAREHHLASNLHKSNSQKLKKSKKK